MSSIIVQAILAIMAMAALGWGYVTGRSFDVYAVFFASVVAWFGGVSVPATIKAWIQSKKPSVEPPKQNGPADPPK